MTKMIKVSTSLYTTF